MCVWPTVFFLTCCVNKMCGDWHPGSVCLCVCVCVCVCVYPETNFQRTLPVLRLDPKLLFGFTSKSKKSLKYEGLSLRVEHVFTTVKFMKTISWSI